MIYIIFFVFFSFFLVLEKRQNSKNNLFRILIASLYILFVGCRGANVGVDTPAYYDHYYTFGQWGCNFVEIGFDWLNRFCYHRGWNQAAFFCICAAITIFPVTYTVGKYESRGVYSIFMFLFCTTTFVSLCNGMRQHMACGIFFALVMFIQNSNANNLSKIVIYILGVLFASLFHASVLLVAPFILLSRLKLSKTGYIVIYVLSFIFIFINVSKYLPDIQIGNRDYGRFRGSNMANYTASSLGFLIMTLRNIIFFMIMLKNKTFERKSFLAVFAYLMLILTNLNFHIPLIGRINMYFSYFYLLFVSKMFMEIKQYQLRSYVSLKYALILLIVVITINAFISPANKISHYSFCWDNNNYEYYIE